MNVMEEFTIEEISAVDTPAQEGAKAVIMKRKEPEMATKKIAKTVAKDCPENPDDCLIDDDWDDFWLRYSAKAEALKIDTVALKAATEAAVKARGLAAVKAIVMPDDMPDDELIYLPPIPAEKTWEDGIPWDGVPWDGKPRPGKPRPPFTMADDTDKSKPPYTLPGVIPWDGKGTPPPNWNWLYLRDGKMMDEEKMDDTDKANRGGYIWMDGEGRRILSREGYPDQVVGHHDDSYEMMDETDKAIIGPFSVPVPGGGKWPPDIPKMKEKATAKGDVIYKAADGSVYSKGDDPRLVALAKRHDEAQAEIAKAKAEAEWREYEKRAEAELNNFPGGTEYRAALLKAIDGMNQHQAEAAQALKAANNAIGSAFDRMSVEARQDFAPSGSESELNKLAKAYADKHGGTPEQAYSEVLKTAEGKRLYAKMYN